MTQSVNKAPCFDLQHYFNIFTDTKKAETYLKKAEQCFKKRDTYAAIEKSQTVVSVMDNEQDAYRFMSPKQYIWSR